MASTAAPPLRPWAADGVLGAAAAIVLLAGAVLGLGPESAPAARPVDAGAIGLSAVAAAAIAVRRRRPVTTLTVLDAVVLAWFFAPYPGRLVALLPLIGCYTLAAERGWRWGLTAAVATAFVEVVAIRVVLSDTETVGIVPYAVLTVATATSAGAAVGYYRKLLAATRAQLERETRAREEQARRIAAEERVRIARELHDVFGHSMATVSVQAGVALHVLDQRPDQARAALASIKKICDEGLTDVKLILGVLREDDTDDGPLAPRPGLDRIGELIDTAAGGLEVHLDVVGDPQPVPAAVDLAAYRIVQEALTNIVRHSRARTATLTVTHEPERLLLRVHDAGPAEPATTGAGHGIDGMRERARALSGRLTAGPCPGGGFEVCAELPIPERR